jgi:beta-glucosidase
VKDLPPMSDYEISSGRTYMYFEGEALYPFGYGLSYSTFDYSSMSVKRSGENIRVSMKVENTGSYDGDEVVQLYYRDVKSSVKRPVKQLLGFERTSLLIGESKTIEFEVPISKLMFWDEACHGWKFEKGRYEFMLGASSGDIRLKKTIVIR